MERTFIILKPDAVQRGIIGEIISRFERVGLKIIGVKMVFPDRGHYHHHYEDISKMITRRGQKAFDVTLEIMLDGPVIAMVLEGVEAVALGRKLVGETEPKAAAPGTIRGDYSHISFDHAGKHDVAIPNVIHASGSVEEAKAEVEHWFSESELFDYSLAHEHYAQPTSRKKR